MRTPIVLSRPVNRDGVPARTPGVRETRTGLRPRVRDHFRLVIIAGLCSVLVVTNASAALREYRVSFSASPSDEAVGYAMYVGTKSGEYNQNFDLGQPPSQDAIIVYAMDLEDSVDLFVAMTAYDQNGAESATSNEIAVAAVEAPAPPPAPAPEPEPEPIPEPEPEPQPAPLPEPTPEPEPEPEIPPTVEPPPAPQTEALLFSDDFESYAVSGDPTGWLDTQRRNSLVEDDRLFEVATSPTGERAFRTTSTDSNIHSHFVGGESANWFNYEYTGRLRFEDAKGGVGVTILSDYPNSDSYLRLRRYRREPIFALAPHPYRSKEVCKGKTTTGVTSQAKTWYAFRFQALDEGGATRVLARVWPEGEDEPAEWQIDCLWSAWETPSGSPGVWSTGSGAKYWDDLRAIRTDLSESASPEVAP